MSEGGTFPELPEGWAWATLSEVVDVLDHLRVPVSAKERAQRFGNVPYYGAAGQVGWIDEAIFDEDLILLGEDGVQFFDADKSKAYTVSGPSWVNNHAHVLRSLAKVIDRRYLIHYLNHFNYEGFANGTTRLKLTKSAMLKIPVPLPPLGEQRCIADALEGQLSRLDAAVESVERGRVRSRQLWSSILHQMAEGTLSPVVRRPVTWECTDQVAAVQGGIQKQARRRPVSNKFPFLRVANVPRGRLALDEVHDIELFGGELDRYRLEVGDLLVVEGNGSPDQIGRAAAWRGEIEDCVHQNHLIRVRPGVKLRPEFLELSWNSPKVSQQLKDVASSTSGLHTLSTTKVKSVKIPVPTLEEQDALLEAVQQWRAKQLAAEAAQQTALVRAAALRRSLLAEAFAGRLAPQDSADEPADGLLTRIRAEREAAGAAKPRHRSSRQAATRRERTLGSAPAPDVPPPAPRADAPTLATATQPTLDLEIPS